MVSLFCRVIFSLFCHANICFSSNAFGKRPNEPNIPTLGDSVSLVYLGFIRPASLSWWTLVQIE